MIKLLKKKTSSPKVDWYERLNIVFNRIKEDSDDNFQCVALFGDIGRNKCVSVVRCDDTETIEALLLPAMTNNTEFALAVCAAATAYTNKMLDLKTKENEDY